MSFLAKLKIFFRSTSKATNEDNFVNSAVQANEPLARFILDKKYLSADGKVKQAAFSPHGKRRDLSVCRSSQATTQVISDLGLKYVAAPTGQTLLGWAEFDSAIPTKHKLILNPDGTPFKRHLNIENWPSECLMIKIEMTNNSKTVLL